LIHYFVLHRFKITKRDLRKQMNDTTLGALKAGRLIVGDNNAEDVLCGMHVMELCIGHAAGYIERSKKGVGVVDSFPFCKEFKEKVKLCAKQVGDRHAKVRMEKFNKFTRLQGMEPIRVQFPNITRVAGNFRLAAIVLRLYQAIDAWVYHNTNQNAEIAQRHMTKKEKAAMFVKENFLTADDWQQLAEFCAIFEKTTALVMDLQADHPASLSIAKLQLTDCVVELSGRPPQDPDEPYDPFDVDHQNLLFDVICVNDPTHKWSPTTLYEDLPRRKMCLPLPNEADDDIVLDQRSWPGVEAPDDDIRKMTMTPHSYTLTKRIMLEFQRYFKTASTDEMICMFLNPFVVMFGLDSLVDLRFYDAGLFDTCKNLVIEEAMKLFGPKKEEVYNKVQVEYDAMVAQSAAQAAAAETVPDVALPVAPGSPLPVQRGKKATNHILAMRRRLAMRMSTAGSTVSAAATVAQPSQSATLTLEQRQERRYLQEVKKHKEAVSTEVDEYISLLESFTVNTGVDESTGEVLMSFEKWTNLLANFPSPLAEKEIAVKGHDIAGYWTDHFVPIDSVYSTKRFNIVGWWSSVDKEKNGGGLFFTLALLAMVHLSQPYTNAFLERVFSRTTWVDGARSQRMLDKIFEMRVLDGSNRKFVELAKPALDLKDRVDKVDTKATSSAIEEAVARFARPLVLPKDPYDESVIVVDKRGDDEEESVVGLTDAQVAATARKEAMKKATKEARDKARKEAERAGTQYTSPSSDDESCESSDEEDDSGGGDEGNQSLFRALDSNEDYHKGIDEVMRYLESTKKPAPSAKQSSKKPAVITVRNTSTK
jgi:hypothetical protein